jgi:hypothetical protein
MPRSPPKSTYATKPAKIDICHAPPDNPINTQLIQVGSKGGAVDDHLSHGDWAVTEALCDTVLDNDCDGTPDDSAATDADCDDQKPGTTDSCNTDTGMCFNESIIVCPCWTPDELESVDGYNSAGDPVPLQCLDQVVQNGKYEVRITERIYSRGPVLMQAQIDEYNQGEIRVGACKFIDRDPHETRYQRFFLLDPNRPNFREEIQACQSQVLDWCDQVL